MALLEVEISTLDEARCSNQAALTIAEVARVLSLDPRTVSSAVRKGELPHVRVGRRILIPRERFLALFERSES